MNQSTLTASQPSIVPDKDYSGMSLEELEMERSTLQKLIKKDNRSAQCRDRVGLAEMKKQSLLLKDIIRARKNNR